MSESDSTIRPIGTVRSALRDLVDAPRQGDEGAPDAWLHRADRRVLRVHPRGEEARPRSGVFATRSPDRPNPIGLHRVTVLEIAGSRLRVAPLEAIDGTPVVDIKPVLGGPDER